MDQNIEKEQFRFARFNREKTIYKNFHKTIENIEFIIK